MKFRKTISSLFAALGGVVFISSAAFASPSYITVGYAPGWNSNPSYNFAANFATDIPWTSLSHTYFAFALVNGTTVSVSDPNATAAAIIAQSHSHGVRCYLSVGGANGNTWPSTTANAQTLADNIAALMNYGGQKFDGVDLDWEFPNNKTVLNALVARLRLDLNSRTPGLAPSGKWAFENNMGLSMYLSPGYDVCGYDFTTLNGLVDWYTASGYDLNAGNAAAGNFQGALNDVALFSNCYGTSYQLSVAQVTNWYNTNGNDGTIPYSKMILGMPLYGRTGTASGNGTAPDATVFSTGVAGAYDAGKKECPYTFGGNTYGMDTAQSFCDKINWAVGVQGMKGIAMWDMGTGLPAGANSMMTSIWNVIGGASACLTVGGGAGSPTATPTATPNCGTLIDNFESGSAQDALGGYCSVSAGGAGCSTTMWPSPFLPTSGSGLSGSLYGGRMTGTVGTEGTCYGPSLLMPLGPTPPGPAYNASTKNSVKFTLKVNIGNASGPTTLIFGGNAANSTSSGFEYFYVVPSVGAETTITIFFSQLQYIYGPVSILDTTQLYQLWWQPFWTGPYDFTIDNVWFTCAPTPTPTWTYTNTQTNTPTPTPSRTSTNTPTNTPTITPTLTFTPLSATNTFTTTATNSPTRTPSPTPSNSPTRTPTPSPTATASPSPTQTPTKTGTNTPTPSNTNTPAAPTNTPTNTGTRTPTNSPSATPSPSPSNTPTLTTTSTGTRTPTPTPTNSITNTPAVPTNTATNSPTRTPTNSPTATPSNSPTRTPTNSPSPTPTLTPSNTATKTPTSTITYTPTDTSTGTLVPTNTATNSPSNTPTPTFTNSATASPTQTGTNSPTKTPTLTPTATASPSPSNSPTLTPTNTPLAPTNTSTNTPTPSITNTVTNTLTNTATNSFTRTATNTPSLTPTSTISNTPTNTPLITNTPSNTPTLSPSNTPIATSTSTPTPATINITMGGASPGNSTQLQGVTNLPVLQIQASNPGPAPATLTSLQLAASGSGNDLSGLSNVSLYQDSNNNGVVDGGDLLLTSGNFSSDNGTINLNFTTLLASSATANYLVVYNFTGAASPGTYQALVLGNNSLTGTNGTTGQPVQFNGAPINSAIITIAAATPTPSSTMTSTPSFTSTPTYTPTFTPSNIPTFTQTPFPTREIEPPYPNPSNGGPVVIEVNVLSTCSVNFDVFTAAFRKIAHQSWPILPGKTPLSWDLRDLMGSPAANGLYYIRVQVTGSQAATKVYKVIVNK